VRLDLDDPDEDWSPVAEVPEGRGCDDEPADEDVACGASFFGTSSSQYQPGIAWKPEDVDMVGGCGTA
jgi:hypothetical protein